MALTEDELGRCLELFELIDDGGLREVPFVAVTAFFALADPAMTHCHTARLLLHYGMSAPELIRESDFIRMFEIMKEDQERRLSAQVHN